MVQLNMLRPERVRKISGPNGEWTFGAMQPHFGQLPTFLSVRRRCHSVEAQSSGRKCRAASPSIAWRIRRLCARIDIVCINNMFM